MSFLKIEGKTFLITGLNNKKSVAYFVAQTLEDQGANLYFSVQNEKQLQFCNEIFSKSPAFICDLNKSESIDALASDIKAKDLLLDGMLHSVAFARFSEPEFHNVNIDDYQEALRISAFSLIELSKKLKNSLHTDASIITISISNLRATSYGYMGPIKAMLTSSIDYLAKSFSRDTRIRFNSVAAGPLKTAASAGIPGYLENYLFSEQLTLRKKGLKTQEVADTACYLLSPRSSGINATAVTVDAGMNVNYFDEKIVDAFNKVL